MPERLSKNQATLAGMFGGEQVALGEEAVSIQENTDIAEGLEQEVSSLPQEIVLYLQTMSFGFAEEIEEMIFNLIEALKEKEAARRLWERFGLPRSTTAVPVFIDLNDELNQAQRVVETEAVVAGSFLSDLLDAINSKVMLFYAEELVRVEESQVENEEAVSQLDTMNTNGNTVQERVAESVTIFSQDNEGLEKEREQILSSTNRWKKFMERVSRSLPVLESFEKSIDLGAPNPAVAL